ncbi:MAG: hypothetical protein RL235_327, partial [Chlamydiota bacterium]
MLIEVLIALTLMSVLLALLFSVITSQLKIHVLMSRAKAKAIEWQQVQLRIQDAILGIDGFLYTARLSDEKQPSLIFRFDNGIDPDPAFSGVVQGRLYVDAA